VRIGATRGNEGQRVGTQPFANSSDHRDRSRRGARRIHQNDGRPRFCGYGRNVHEGSPESARTCLEAAVGVVRSRRAVLVPGRLFVPLAQRGPLEPPP
jgi:hypothetical protein